MRVFAKLSVRTVLASAALSGLMLTLAPTAQAVTPEVDDAKLVEIGTSESIEALASLSEAELARFVELSQVTSVEVVETDVTPSKEFLQPSSALGALAISCRTARRDTSGSNALGNTIYTTWIEIQVCGGDGTPITSNSIVSQGGNATWAGWSFEGTRGQASGIVNGQARQYVQHQFRLAIFQVGVIQEVNPCTSLDSSGINSFGNIVLLAVPTTRCGLS